MQEQVVMPTKLNPGMISVLRFKYTEFTDEFIQRILTRLYCDDLINPEYLFVGVKGRGDIERTQRDLFQRNFPSVGQSIELLLDQYPNITTGKMMYVVELPTLPDNMFLLGNLILPDWNGYGIWGDDTSGREI